MKTETFDKIFPAILPPADFNTAPQDSDPLHTAHAFGELHDGRENQDGIEKGDFIVGADDGNESSYGHSVFRIDDNMVTLIADWGRDCFDDTLAFAIYGDEIMGKSDPDGRNYTPADLTTITPISLHVFKLALESYIDDWTERSIESVKDQF